MTDDRLIDAHRDLVPRLARRLRSELGLQCDVRDLEGYGFEGLVQAAARFDPARGVQFSTFAYYRIRGAILDGVRKMAFLPRRLHRRLQLLESTDGVTEPLADARAAAAPSTLRKEDALTGLDGALADITTAFALSAMAPSHAGEPESPEGALLASEAADRLRDAVECLPPREQALVRGFYFEGRRFDEVASDLGISKSWASRLHAKALELLRRHLETG